jgi:hypothetical protein
MIAGGASDLHCVSKAFDYQRRLTLQEEILHRQNGFILAKHN